MIVIVDCGMGNLSSIQNMFKKAGAEAVISSEIKDIERADHLVLPGVGSFDAGISQLRQRGLVEILSKKVLEKKTPILGICLGMQLMTQRSEEGKDPGLGWIDGETVRFRIDGQDGLKVPHMGWNTVRGIPKAPLLAGYQKEPRFYFVHSYHVVCRSKRDILAETYHGYDFVSAFAKENIYGVQFHPEKSHKFGLQLFKNFLALS